MRLESIPVIRHSLGRFTHTSVTRRLNGKISPMFDDVYDATLIHQPEQSDIEIDGELCCPSCEEKFFPDMSDDVLSAAVEGPIAAPVECPGCGASLEFLIEPLPTEEIGLGIKVVQP